MAMEYSITIKDDFFKRDDLFDKVTFDVALKGVSLSQLHKLQDLPERILREIINTRLALLEEDCLLLNPREKKYIKEKFPTIYRSILPSIPGSKEETNNE